MTNLRSWFAATTCLVGSLLPQVAGAVALPVKIDAFQGEVVQVSGTIHSGVTPGKALASGTEVKTGGDGRADLSLHGVPTLKLGNGVELLLHSMDQEVLRIRVASGAVGIDTRTPATPGGKGRDVRVNAGDLRLRLAGAEAWVEVGDRTGQVCVIAGVVEVQQATGAVRLDTPGQCLRQTGPSSQWTMVPTDLLQVRVAATGVQKVVAAVPPPLPKPPLQIKVLPLPGTIPEGDPSPPPEPGAAPAPAKPPIVVLQQAPETTSLDVKLASADVPDVPPPPEPLPVTPAAATVVAVKLAAPVEVPEVPPAPAPLPVAPAPAARLAVKAAEPVEVPVVPDPPAPLPVAPAPATAVSMKIPEPIVSPPEMPPAPVAVVAPSRPKPVLLPAEPITAVEPVAPAPATRAPIAAPAPAPTTEVATAAPVTAAPAPTTPAADDGRRWRVVLGSMPEKEKADIEAERLNARGWAVEAREYRVGERRGFRIGFGEFTAREDAQKALEEFLVQYPDAPAWLAKY